MNAVLSTISQIVSLNFWDIPTISQNFGVESQNGTKWDKMGQSELALY